MRFVDKWPSRMQVQIIFGSRVEHTTIFGWYGIEINFFSRGGYPWLLDHGPQPLSKPTQKFVGGRFNIGPSTLSPRPT